MNFSQPKNISSVVSVINSSLYNNNNNKTYSFKSSHTSPITSKNSIASLLIESYFFSLTKNIESLIYSTPTYSNTNDKVTIHIFYYNSEKHSTKPFQKTLSEMEMFSLSNSLASVYKKEISLVLTRIYYPYLNSSIFTKYLAHNAPSNTFIHFQDSIITYPSRNASKLPSYISGIKIELSGRLLTEAVVPRITKKATLFGSFSGIVDYSKYTTKNELGAFTIKVWIAQQIKG